MDVSMETEFTGPDRRSTERRTEEERRETVVDRRIKDGLPPEEERRDTVIDRRSGLDRRRGPGRRRSDMRKAAEEGEMTDDLLEFVMAIDEYKRVNKKPFPSWSEVFEVIWYLGYRKVANVGEHINKPTERAADETSDTAE